MIEDPEIIGMVTGPTSSPLTWNVEFSDLTLDTVNTSANNISRGTLENSDGLVEDMTLNLSVIKIDADGSDGCDDFENDCDVTWKLNSSLVEDGALIDLAPGLTNVTMNISCVRWSCSQNITGSFLLEKL